MEKCFIQMRAHNAEKTIKKAISSVLMQDYPNIELIVLDDGSTDKTADIIKSYNNPNIHYMHQEQKGPAGAFLTIVNETLKRAKEDDFILSLDADDFYTRKNGISDVVNKMKNTDANLCIINMEFYGDSSFILQPGAGSVHRGVVERLDTENKATNAIKSPYIVDADTTLWSKVYRKDILQKYVSMLPEFPKDLMVCEDFPATTNLFMKDAKITALANPFYGFYKSGDSITARPTANNFSRDRIQFIKMTQEMVANNKNEFIQTAPSFINQWVVKKYNIISDIVDNKVKSGDLKDYSKEKFQSDFKREVNLQFLKEKPKVKEQDQSIFDILAAKKKRGSK